MSNGLKNESCHKVIQQMITAQFFEYRKRGEVLGLLYGKIENIKID